MLGEPFVGAADRAQELGVCPVGMLEELYSGHWVFDDLCSGFSCGECVATPEDVWGIDCGEPWPPELASWEIDF